MRCDHPQLNYYKSPLGNWNVHCGTCCLTGPFVTRVEDAKEAFLSEARIKNYKDLYYWFDSVGFKNIQDIIRPEVDQVDIYRQANEAYNKIMSYSINPTPYWIIVSDEGHAAIPAKHLTKEAADAEAKRLTAAKPGVNFTVFEAKYSLKTPKAEAVKTVYETSYTWGRGYFYPNPSIHWQY